MDQCVSVNLSVYGLQLMKKTNSAPKNIKILNEKFLKHVAYKHKWKTVLQ